MSKYHKMFKAYDLRATYPELNADVYYWAGYGLVTEILKPDNLSLNINVARDCRYTSPDFYKAFYNGLKDAGANPVCLGLASTDFIYAACQIFDTPGAMITASHNPKDDNGLKIVKKFPQMLGLQAGLDKVRDFVLSKIEIEKVDFEKFTEPQEDTKAKMQVWDYYKSKFNEIGNPEEVDQVLAQQQKKLKIVVDTGNGMGGFMMEKIQNWYKNIEFIPLYWELDGNYPNHPADPSNIANIQDLINKVKEVKADLGVAFDGDADRAYFVDEKGEYMRDNYLVAAIAKSMLKDYFANPNPEFNPAIVYSQPQSRCVPYTVLESSGVPVPSKQGHTFVKADMKRYKAIYGGEGTGHHYFGTFGFMDSGSLVVSKVIHIMVTQKVLPSEIVATYASKYFLSGELNYRLGEDLNFDLIKERLLNHYKDAVVNTFDGISLFYLDWKVNMRASNTEPLIRLNVECLGENKLEEKIKEITRITGLA